MNNSTNERDTGVSLSLGIVIAIVEIKTNNQTKLKSNSDCEHLHYSLQVIRISHNSAKLPLENLLLKIQCNHH